MGNNGNSDRLYFEGSKITAGGDFSHEIKRLLFLERKVLTNLDSILKSRDITLPTKVCLVKAMVFPVVTYGCDSWTIKKADCWRADAFFFFFLSWCFLTVVLEKTFESPLDCKEIKPVSLKGNQAWIFTGRTYLMLKLQYFGHLIWRADSLEETLMLGKTEGRRRRGQQRMRWFDDMINPMDMS